MAITRLGLYGGPRAPYPGFIPAAASISVSISSLTEAQIVAGGQSIVLTVTNDTFVATVGDDNGITTALIAGLDSDQAEATGWDAVVKAGLTHAAVTRDSSTQLTILLPAFVTYDIAAAETVTITVPATALTTASVGVIAAPTISISVVTIALGGGGGKKKQQKKGWPRRIYIDGKLYTVRSPQEERELLRQWRDTLQARQEALVSQEAPPAVVRKAKIKVVKAQRRIDRVDTREEEWLARLQAEDEEILMAVLH